MVKFRILAAAALLAASSSSSFAATKAKDAAWLVAKADAKRWTAALLVGVAKSGRYNVASYKDGMDQAWSLAASIEDSQEGIHRKRVAAVPSAESLSLKILELNLLYVYGNIFPRLVDESTDLAPGRAYAGGDLHVAIEEADYRTKFASLSAGAEFPPRLVHALPGPRRDSPAGSSR